MSRPTSFLDSVRGLRRIQRRFQPHISANRKLVAGSFAALFAGVLFRALQPWPLKIVFDYLLVPTEESLGGLRGVLESLSNETILIGSGLAIIIIMSFRALFMYLRKVGFALVGNRVLTTVRSELYDHIQRLPLNFHFQSRGGDLVVRVISDIGMLKEVVVTAFMPLMASFLTLMVMLSLMFWLNWKLTLLVAITFPLYWIPTIKLGRKIQNVSRRQRKIEGGMASTAAESMAAIDVVKTLSLEKVFSETFSGQNKSSLKDGVKAKRLTAKLESTVQVMTAISTASVLAYGGFQVINGALSAGSLLVFLSYLKSAFRPIQDFAKYTGRLAKASAAGERIVQVLDQKPDIVDGPDSIEAEAFSGDITFENISYSYDASNPVIKDLNLSINQGDSIAIVGPSGQGKSTLGRLLPRLMDPQSGRVLIDGRDIKTFKVASLRKQIAVVLQNNLLFATSIRENISHGLLDVDEKDIIAAAKLANAHAFISRLPDGYDTVIGERGSTLSAGQRQRIAIARVAVKNVPILILDEPTTGLDEKNKEGVIEALQRLSETKTTILITHDLDLAAKADRIVVLSEGEIVESGTHTSLLKKGGEYASMHNQASIRRANFDRRFGSSEIRMN